MKTLEIIGLELPWQLTRLILLIASSIFIYLRYSSPEAKNDKRSSYSQVASILFILALGMRWYEHYQLMNHESVQASGVEYFLKKVSDVISAILGYVILIPIGGRLKDSSNTKSSYEFGTKVVWVLLAVSVLNTIIVFLK